MKSREYGVIQTYNGAFCFIRPETGERDVFAHESELPDGIRRGDRVSFDLPRAGYVQAGKNVRQDCAPRRRKRPLR
jgi:cold shock CspA family protein